MTTLTPQMLDELERDCIADAPTYYDNVIRHGLALIRAARERDELAMRIAEAEDACVESLAQCACSPGVRSIAERVAARHQQKKPKS